LRMHDVELESRRLRPLCARAQSRGNAQLAACEGGASAADKLAFAGAKWPSGLDPPTQGGEKCERWSCQHLRVASNSLQQPPLLDCLRKRSHGHARVQRAQPCSAAQGRQPAGTAPGNGWRWPPEPLRCIFVCMGTLRTNAAALHTIHANEEDNGSFAVVPRTRDHEPRARARAKNYCGTGPHGGPGLSLVGLPNVGR